MIRTWKNSVSRKVYDEGRAPKRFGSLDLEAAEEALTLLNQAGSLNDLRFVRYLRLHRLRGSRRAQWSITINGPWRICFRYVEAEGDAYDVEVTDHH